MKKLTYILLLLAIIQLTACGGGATQSDHAKDTSETNGSVGESNSPNAVRNSTGKPMGNGDTSTLQTNKKTAQDTGKRTN